MGFVKDLPDANPGITERRLTAWSCWHCGLYRRIAKAIALRHSGSRWV
jgi:hypothetical protein